MVPEVSAVIIHTEVVSDTVASSYSGKFNATGDTTRTKWKEVDAEFSPPIDIVELQDSYHIYAEVPGMNIKELSIDLSDNLFSLTGGKIDHPLLSRTRANEGVVVQEINRGGRFKRVLELPENVDTSDVVVAYEAGILQCKIRKIEKEELPEEDVAASNEGAESTLQEEPTEVTRKPKHRKTKGGKKRSSCAIQ